MKLNELIKDFTIYTTNEEKKILESIDSVCFLDSFDERQQVIIDNLIKKNLLSKFIHKGKTMVLKNGY
jgi:hypothetical protein